jgi:hypothetical protein
METALSVVVSLSLLIIFVYFNWVRLFCVLNMLWLSLGTLSLGAVMYYALPGAETLPGHGMFYLPALHGLIWLGLAIAVAMDKGRQLDAPETVSRFGKLPWVLGGILVLLIGTYLCLAPIYVQDPVYQRGDILDTQPMFSGLVLLFGAALVSFLLLAQASRASKLVRWITYVASQSLATTPIVVCMIYIYAVPDQIPRSELAAWGSLCTIPAGALIWWLNRNRPVVAKMNKEDAE